VGESFPHTSFSGKFWEILAKYSLHPAKIACSCTYTHEIEEQYRKLYFVNWANEVILGSILPDSRSLDRVRKYKNAAAENAFNKVALYTHCLASHCQFQMQ